jgi:hypothetical protein
MHILLPRPSGIYYPSLSHVHAEFKLERLRRLRRIRRE